MRATLALIVLPALLFVAGCSAETLAPDTAPASLSVAPQNPNIPTGENGDVACPGGFARGERIDEYRDGSAQLFCD
jgi:hypothetical protein